RSCDSGHHSMWAVKGLVELAGTAVGDAAKNQAIADHVARPADSPLGRDVAVDDSEPERRLDARPERIAPFAGDRDERVAPIRRHGESRFDELERPRVQRLLVELVTMPQGRHRRGSLSVERLELVD